MESIQQIATQKIELALRQHATSLDLSGLDLSHLPPEIVELKHLKHLNISNNQLQNLSPEIGHLNHLEHLDVSHNALQSIARAIRKLGGLRHFNLSHNKLNSLPRELGQLSKLETLNLAHNNLMTVPRAVKFLVHLKKLHLNNNRVNRLAQDFDKLKALEHLDVSYNQIGKLPKALSDCKKLVYLNVSTNQLANLGAFIGHCSSLQQLLLAHNHLHSIPAAVARLKHLHLLDLRHNHLTSLPHEIKELKKLQIAPKNANKLEYGLLLHKNRLGIPDEVLNGSVKDIIQYVIDLQTSKKNKPLHEAKVIFIGSGYVGKTSLINMLVQGAYNPQELKTDGIQIKQWSITRQKDTIKLHVWDFGGQEIMHATHKFFMTGRSVYVLVITPRTEDKYGDSELEYWLKLIGSYADNVPIVVAVNKCETHRVDIPKTAIRTKYRNIIGFVETSCKENIGLKRLEKEITKAITQLPHINDLLPQSYFDIKRKLEDYNDDYISYHQYQMLCKEVDPNFQRESMTTLMRLLHDLGVMLNFNEDRRLMDTQVLNPEWVTRGVYQIVTSPQLIKKRGILTLRQIANILDNKLYPNERERYYIMDIMDHFELCYQVPYERNKYFVPGAFPKDRPKLSWQHKHPELLRFQYHYDVMPSSIMSRYIVKVHDFIRNRDYWRNGVIICKDNCAAFVFADPEDRKIYIEVAGKNNKRDVLSFVRGQFELIHAKLNNIRVQSKIPVDELGTVVLDYEDMLFYEEIGEMEIPVRALRRKINVLELLNGIESASARDEQRQKTGQQQFVYGAQASKRLGHAIHPPTMPMSENEGDIVVNKWARMAKWAFSILLILAALAEFLSFLLQLWNL